jgi:DNA invertase Pin-like site-specific DNA recombinase
MKHLELNEEVVNPIRCAIYKRVACQIQNDNSDSLMEQEMHCRNFANRSGWTVLDEHVYEDQGKSGSSINGRGGLTSLIDNVMAKPRLFDLILVSDTSRLSRNLADLLKLYKILNDHRVHFRFVTQDLTSTDAMLQLLLTLPGMVA